MFVAQETGHRAKVTFMALNIYHNIIATCSMDKTIRIFDCSNQNSFTHIQTLDNGHDAEICQIAWSHPFSGDFLASCGMDHRVVIWKSHLSSQNSLLCDFSTKNSQLNTNLCHKLPQNWEIDFIYKDFEASVNSVDFSPYQFGTKLIAVGADKKILILSLNVDLMWIIDHIIDDESVSLGMFFVNWAPASSSIIKRFDSDGNFSKHMISRFAVGGFDGILQIWQNDTFNSIDTKSSTWNLEFRSDPLPDWIRVLQWCPLPTNDTSPQLAVGLHDGRVFLWQYCEDSAVFWTARILIRGERYVSSIAWSSCGTLLSISFADIRTVVLRRNIDQTWTKLCTRVQR